MQKLIVISLLFLTFFQSPKTLKGTWEYRGGKFNNKLSAAPKGYAQQRIYTDSKYEAFMYENGQPPLKYESGNYALKGDTCLETQTYSLQPSKLKDVTVPYFYVVHKDTLFLVAKLPSGAVEEDFWVKVK
ncbi:MAG TPA: hypothetical protein VGM63_02810 [Mucilaginibacter sp.]|jgi:hypothetical protein